MEARIDGEKIIVEGRELYDEGWYGKIVRGKTELDLLEACLLVERGKIEIKNMELKEFLRFCSENDKSFIPRYVVYRDLRERGLPVRMGFKGCDFRVYDRGSGPKKAETVKWIVFATSEDYECKIDVLGRMGKLAKNIRAQALLAVVDNDSDVTYYISSELTEL